MTSATALYSTGASTAALDGGASMLSSFVTITGEADILALQPKLVDLARRCGQDQAVAFMTYTFSQLVATTPVLLLRFNPATEIEAAVLLREYRVHGFRTAVYIPTDFAGERDVIAPPEVRGAICQMAAEYLIRQGARLVLVALHNEGLAGPAKYKPSSARFSATLIRDASRTLLLASSVEGTLARFGRHTRRNLRLVRRRAQTELGACFVANARLSETQFLAFNRLSSHPVSRAMARWRFRSIQGDGFISGVRINDGRWLSLIGGRRHGQSTHIDWQLNNESFSALSPRSVMRSFLMEHEVERGTGRITFEGGTTHSINRAFVPETVTYLLLTQSPLSPFVCRHLLARMLPDNNLLAGVLSDQGLVWHQ